MSGPVPFNLTTRALPPGWVQRLNSCRATGEVQGGEVSILGVRLILKTQISDGTRLSATVRDGNVILQDAQELDAEREAIQTQIQSQQQQRDVERDAQQLRAYEANLKLRLPVPFTVGFKARLSGLLSHSDGSGHARNTRCHILLLGELHEGKLYRPAQSFLCTSASRTNGREWVPPAYRGPVHTLPAVNCPVCLRLAQTLSKSSAATYQVAEALSSD